MSVADAPPGDAWKREEMGGGLPGVQAAVGDALPKEIPHMMNCGCVTANA